MNDQAQKLKERVISVDVLRGLAMFIILSTQIGGAPIFKTFSNMVWGDDWPGFVASQLSWANHRASFINIAQPIFVFVVGVVIPFSLKRRLLKSDKKSIYLHVLRRSVILVLCGFIAGGFLLNFKSDTFYFYNNVLEYIAVCYLICSVLVLNTTVKAQYIIAAVMLLLYWAIWLFIPAPGWDGDIYSNEMNIGIYLDQVILGPHGHEYGGGWTAVLNTYSQVINTLLGVLMGHIIFSERSKKEKTKLLFISGFAMLFFGLAWGQFFPVMRCFMTSSFVLVTCGIATILLASFHQLIDVRGYKKWSFFFYVFGVNSIAIYMMAHTFDFSHIGNVLVGGTERHPFGITGYFPEDVRSFVQALTAMAVMWLIMYYMYRKKTFIKI
ncbi:MAG: hypothetical protein PHG29_08905 [Prolixibacteraceae bacterium]|nr:hypothetical protein [Prolixibacteraceae bacterium]